MSWGRQSGLALSAASNVLGALDNRVQVLGDLATDPQLRAAINQTPSARTWLSPAVNQAQPAKSIWHSTSGLPSATRTVLRPPRPNLPRSVQVRVGATTSSIGQGAAQGAG